MDGLLGGEWFEQALSGPLPHQEGWKERMARIAAQANQPAPDGAWDDPRVRERMLGLIDQYGGLGGGGLLTEITKPGKWGQLLRESYKDKYGRLTNRGASSIWSTMRHEGTDYDKFAKSKAGREMFRSQEKFDEGTRIVAQLADEALRAGRKDVALEQIAWLKQKAERNWPLQFDTGLFRSLLGSLPPPKK